MQTHLGAHSPSVLVKKCVAPIHALMVPNGCSRSGDIGASSRVWSASTILAARIASRTDVTLALLSFDRCFLPRRCDVVAPGDEQQLMDFVASPDLHTPLKCAKLMLGELD